MTRPSRSPLAPLRVGIVAHAELGGSGTVATDLAMGLAARGHDVHMITPRRPFRLASRCEVLVHEVTVAPHDMWESAPWSLAVASRVATVAAEAELDVLHAHFAIPYAVATELACRILGADAPPWIATLHGSDVEPLGNDPSYAPVLKYALSRAHHVTVPSQHLRELAEQQHALPIEVIPNFVDGERFRPSPSRPLPSRGATFIHASNFRPVKRVGDVVAIFAAVAASTPARLLLVGDGPEREAALAELAARGLTDRVEAPGAQTDIERWLARAHVALLPSDRESFGLSALEALASGVPVVGTNVGGLPEVVEHGRTGYLAPVGDVTAMANAARALATDDEGWQEQADAARARALASFTPSRAIDAYEALYRAAIAHPAPDSHRLRLPSPRPFHDA